MAKAGQSELLGAHAAAGRGGTLQNHHFEALLSQSNGGGQSVGSGTHNHSIIFVSHPPGFVSGRRVPFGGSQGKGMKSWQIPSFGALELVERPKLTLESHQVRLRIRAVSLNYRDHLMLQGVYNPKQPLPLVPCSDGSGEVLEVGSAVKSWKVGDRVCPIFAQTWISGPPNRDRISQTLGGPLDGTLQPELVVDQQGLVAVPAHLDWEEAATLPCAAVTAWNAIHDLPAGSRVVVQGTGGVSLFALQLAKAAGMEVLATSSSPEKLKKAKQLGATRWSTTRRTRSGAGLCGPGLAKGWTAWWKWVAPAPWINRCVVSSRAERSL